MKRPVSEVIAKAKSGELSKIEVSGDKLTVYPKGDVDPFESKLEKGDSITSLLLGERGFHRAAQLVSRSTPKAPAVCQVSSACS